MIDLDEDRQPAEQQIAGQQPRRRVLGQLEESQDDIIGVDRVVIDAGQVNLRQRALGEQQQGGQGEEIASQRLGRAVDAGRTRHFGLTGGEVSRPQPPCSTLTDILERSARLRR